MFETFCEMTESPSLHWMVLYLFWAYGLVHAVIAAMPPSIEMGWTLSVFMSYIYQGILTIVSSFCDKAFVLQRSILPPRPSLFLSPPVSDAICRLCRFWFARRAKSLLRRDRLRFRYSGLIWVALCRIFSSAKVPPPLAVAGAALLDSCWNARSAHPAFRDSFIAAELQV